MNRLKYLFTYTIVVIIALTSDSCKEDSPLDNLACNSDCLEFKGLIWNASANKPETDRRINVFELAPNGIEPDNHFGYVRSNEKGEFYMKINKKQLRDSVHLSIGFELQAKGGYLNDENSLSFYASSIDLNNVNEIKIDVYEEANLSYLMSNKHSTDTMVISSISHEFRRPIFIYGVNINIPPGGSYVYSLNTAAGIEAFGSVRYKVKGTSNSYSLIDSIVPTKNQNNKLIFDLK